MGGQLQYEKKGNTEVSISGYIVVIYLNIAYGKSPEFIKSLSELITSFGKRISDFINDIVIGEIKVKILSPNKPYSHDHYYYLR